jgi:hypothetical protein
MLYPTSAQWVMVLGAAISNVDSAMLSTLSETPYTCRNGGVASYRLYQGETSLEMMRQVFMTRFTLRLRCGQVFLRLPTLSKNKRN